MKDYYQILEINKNSDKNTIKNAYKKLALKYHPDKNMQNKEEAEKKFKEISEAYEVLSDDEKKKIMIMDKILLFKIVIHLIYLKIYLKIIICLLILI